MVEDGDGDAPAPLTRDTPVRPSVQHCQETRPGRLRHHAHLLQRLLHSQPQRKITAQVGDSLTTCHINNRPKTINDRVASNVAKLLAATLAYLSRVFQVGRVYEPLLAGSDHHRLLTAPVVRVTVHTLLLLHQSSGSAQHRDHCSTHTINRTSLPHRSFPGYSPRKSRKIRDQDMN